MTLGLVGAVAGKRLPQGRGRRSTSARASSSALTTPSGRGRRPASSRAALPRGAPAPMAAPSPGVRWVRAAGRAGARAGAPVKSAAWQDAARRTTTHIAARAPASPVPRGPVGPRRAPAAVRPRGGVTRGVRVPTAAAPPPRAAARPVRAGPARVRGRPIATPRGAPRDSAEPRPPLAAEVRAAMLPAAPPPATPGREAARAAVPPTAPRRAVSPPSFAVRGRAARPRAVPRPAAPPPADSPPSPEARGRAA